MAKSQRRSTGRATRRPAARKAARKTTRKAAALKKTLKAAAPRRAAAMPVTVDLDRVAHRALEDPAFFRALEKNVDRALVGANWQLRRQDVATLKRSLSGTLGAPARVVLHPRRVFQVLHRLPPGVSADLERAWGIGWGRDLPAARASARRMRGRRR